MEFERIKAFLTISRAKIQLGTPPHPLLWLILGSATLAEFASVHSALYLALYFLLITFACNVNSLSDVDIDERYKRYMSRGVKTLGKGNVKILITLEAILALGLIYFFISRGFFLTSILALSGLIFGYIYSAEPLRVKKRGFFSPFPVLIGLYSLPVLGGWFIFQNSLNPFIILFTIGYALLNEGITLVNTCEDYREDLAEGVRTWAHVFSIEGTLRFAFLFTLLGGLTAVVAVALKPFYLGWSTYTLYSSVIFISMGVLDTLFILRASTDIYGALGKDDLQKACKKSAKKMPQWFISTRYPLVLMGLGLLVSL